MKKLFILCLLGNSILMCASPRYPVDISYLISDFKYSKQDGLKMCELQHGALSALTGDLYIHGNDGTISPLIADFLINLE